MDQDNRKRNDDEESAKAHGDAPSDPVPAAIPPPRAAEEEALPPASEGKDPAETGPGGRHDHDENHPLKAKLKRKDHEIKELKKEAHELKDKYLRFAAEMENLRKRLDREKTDFLQFAQADLLKELLGVQDNFERALKVLSGPENPAAAEGIALIAKQLMELLRKRGVTEIEAEGKPFDPTVHSAVVSAESKDVKEPVIGEVFQKGFRLNGRLLRPALVKVLVPAES